MFIWILATVAVAAFVVSIISSHGRRSGLLELGSVSTQWLAEHRQYQDGDRSR
jgi:hypothetical protein